MANFSGQACVSTCYLSLSGNEVLQTHPTMIIKTFTFNPFQVNTYLLYDDTKECVIIDPACYEPHEETALISFIEEAGLRPVSILFTHGHVDHILGGQFVCNRYGLKPQAHKDALPFLANSVEHGRTFGFEAKKPVMPEEFLSEGDTIRFGKQQMKVILTPGHADGSLCFYHEKDRVLIAGDVLFQEGIGRTDLPTGDYDTLITSINSKLFTLPPDVEVFPGHGPSTTIGHERDHNPFL
jgi:hydroxyacylglutathione hydrolase